MRPLRPGGRAAARRLCHSVLPFLSVVLLGLPTSARADELTGTVVDQSGHALVRARVRLVGPSGVRDVFTDDTGTFAVSSTGACRLEASLPGFRTTSVPCATGGQMRIELPLAPVEESVIVTATRTEAPASQTGVSVTTFTAEDIERRQAPLVTDLLRTAPGVMMLQTGGPGGVSSLFVRGGESNYNTVLVDGIPVNEPGGTFNFNNLTTANLERVEIVRGASSALFGSDAMASVVQLFTKRGAAGASKPAGRLQIDGGSYGTVNASGALSGAIDRVDYSVGVSRLSTDNRVANNAFDNTTVSANVGTTIGARSTLRGVVRGELGRTGTPGQTAYGRPDTDAFFEHHDVVGGLTLETQLTPSLHQRATYSLSSSRQASTNLSVDPSYTPSYQGRTSPFAWDDYTFDSHTILKRHFASYQADWHVARGAAGDHRLTALADWNGERATLEDRLATTRAQASRDNVGVSLQHQMLIGRLATTAGARVEHNDSFGSAVVPRGSAVFTVRESAGTLGDTRVHAAAGLGIKEPTVLQTFSTSPYFAGNPDLKPERARSVEAGVEQRLAGDHVKVDATWFDSRFRNIIGLRSTGAYTSQYFNIGLTRARGLELAGEVAPAAALHVRAGYTLVDSEILESTSAYSPVFAAGQWAFRRPRHSGFVQGSFTWQRLTADLTGVAIGRFVDSDFASLDPPIVQNPGRTTWDGRLAWRFTSSVTGLVSVDNISNRDYQEPLGYYALQRATRVGLRVAF